MPRAQGEALAQGGKRGYLVIDYRTDLARELQERFPDGRMVYNPEEEHPLKGRPYTLIEQNGFLGLVPGADLEIFPGETAIMTEPFEFFAEDFPELFQEPIHVSVYLEEASTG